MITPERKHSAEMALLADGFSRDEVAELLNPPASMRDEFAGRAMAAMVGASMAELGRSRMSADAITERVSTAAYRFADGMLAARGGAR